MESKKNNIFLKLLMILVIIGLIAVLGWLVYGYYKNKTLNIANPVATMEVEKYGTIKIELYPDKAPNTVKNFIKLSNNGYYNGLKFHRVIKDFMIQGGDSAGDGTGGVKLKDLYQNDNDEEYNIEGEFIANGFTKNDINLTEGTIAMARADYTNYSPNLYKQSYNSAGSQFFIMTTNDHTGLSGTYAGFGRVIEGMDVVKKIAAVEVKVPDDKKESEGAEKSTPKKDVKIKTLTVETNGYDYGMPETLTPFDLMKWFTSQYGG